MHDMNFFSVYKKRRAKSKGLRIFLIVLIAALLIVNGALIGGGLWLFSQLEADIQAKQDWINDPATREAIAEAERIQQEVELTQELVSLLEITTDVLSEKKILTTDLLSQIRLLAPADTVFNSASYNENSVSLNCFSTVTTDAMDMYHACLNSDLFANVAMSGFSISDDGSIQFSITLRFKGGDES